MLEIQWSRLGFRVSLVLLLAAGLAPIGAAHPGAGDRLLELVEQYYEEILVLNPILATYNGDHRFDDRFTIAISPESVKHAMALERRYLKRVESIDPEGLDSRQRLTRDLFLRGRKLTLDGERFPGELLPVDQLQSMPVIFGMLGSGAIQPFKSVKDYDNWLKRMKGWSGWVDQAIVNLRKGIETEVVLPRIIVERTVGLLNNQIESDPRASSFFGPIKRMPAAIDGQQRKRLELAYATAIRDEVIPAYRRLRDFLQETYLPKARRSVGMSELPDGREWYAHLVRQQTTTDLTPDEIHRLGLAEVKRLQDQIERVRSDAVSSGPRSDYGDGRLLNGFRSLKTLVESRLPSLFERIPSAEFEIRPVEKFRRQSSAGASYMAGTPDGSRKGVFYVNASESSRGTPSEALFLHEALPGHHFQISLQRELGELPRFRRFGHQTAFIEGWALYVERLGPALGLYRSREQKLRALDSELFRARRLVVDTGLHAKGWSRERAIDYIGSVTEVDRYIGMPGQALAYKIGQLQILKLRERAEQALGERFDIRAFHRVVLEEGAIPLDVLEDRVEAWIAGAS